MLPYLGGELCKKFKRHRMIKELVNFIEDLERNDPEIHQKNVELKEGLYLFIRFEEGGKITIVNQLPYYEKKVEETKITKDQVQKAQLALYQRCLSLQQVLVPVAQTKIFNPNAKIFGVTCSPFALGFNKKNIDGGADKKDTQAQKVKEAIIQYFETAKKYIDVTDEALKLQFTSWYNLFSDYCKQNLITLLDTIEDYKSIKEGGIFNVFLILDEPNYSDFKLVHDSYFSKNIFNKEEFNKEDAEGLIRGVPDSLYTYNGKKPFLQHQSSPFNLKFRTSGEEAKVIWQFYNLQKNKILPNPLPIFIDKRELLNKELVSLFCDEKKESYTDIIQSLFVEHKEDLGGYYLLFIQKGEIIDSDFVPNFQYYISDCELRQADCLNCNYVNKEGQTVNWKLKGEVKDIFSFQNKLANKLLGLELETSTKAGGKWLKYFGDVEYNPKYMTEIQYNLFLKYRLAFYNYVYKSQRKSINKRMFDDIMINGIMDDLRHDEVKDNRHTKQYDIKEKILIWFSLYDFFEQNNKNNKDMINLSQQLFDELKAFTKGEEATLKTVSPELFAFASGQVIREILQKSRSDKRTHALLEPFLQKTDTNLFKLAIARAFETYKHEFPLFKGKGRYEFDRTMSLVMGASDDKINVKDLLPYILAGYFSDTIFFKEKEANTTTEQ
jgi:CRISPR-associated protein Csh1